MGCTHLDVEETIEKCSGIIKKKEEIESANKVLGCIVCSSSFLAEICIDCNNVYCRDNFHIEKHWKESWHKNYFVPEFATVSCEECAEYISIRDINRMNTNTPDVSKKYQCLNTNWVKGFLNLKRTCYMSSLLQSILSIKEFIKNLLDIDHILKKCAIKECILCSLNRILHQMYSNTDGYVDISELIRIFWGHAPSFAKSEYQDVQEFFMFLSSQVHSILKCNAMDKCPIHKTFGGTFLSTIQCACGRNEASFELFTSISMQLHGSTLEETVDRYFNEELIHIDKICECGNSKEYTKKVEIKELPSVLCLHLKRYEMKNKNVLKIDTVISYPEVLIINDKVFNLYSIIMHSGDIDSGHYIAYTRRNSQWYLTNDEEIMRVSLVDVLNKPVYILFYTEEDKT
ncbi:ubiquitin carboxyl-terminal hydrolase 22/27/51 [Nematocida minor]|uniref:ubiquitin carboxyl-terminal hydrolase 22/27/51 n=1 Tax=Nematocida minor TaxID=1912983 RepID=UPI002220E986|nr:ubiquitin carboxyl-terminal hydrolase 22/27/51 [Nematocida minor]KAI5189209.1 ubiquitin carboxyl-terminal hydrolase 22/27/51 [Nematocida minor]